jgi:hypothetical protein
MFKKAILFFVYAFSFSSNVFAKDLNVKQRVVAYAEDISLNGELDTVFFFHCLEDEYPDLVNCDQVGRDQGYPIEEVEKYNGLAQRYPGALAVLGGNVFFAFAGGQALGAAYSAKTIVVGLDGAVKGAQIGLGGAALGSSIALDELPYVRKVTPTYHWKTGKMKYWVERASKRASKNGDLIDVFVQEKGQSTHKFIKRLDRLERVLRETAWE